MNPRETFESAVRLHQAGRTAQAEPLYRAIVAAFPGHADALHLLGLCRLQAGYPGEAADFIRRSVALNPANPEPQNSLGAALIELGRIDEALAALDCALALDPQHGAALVNRGRALDENGHHEQALDCYRRADAAGLRTPALHYNRGNALHRLGRFEEAARAFEVAVTLDPADARAHCNLGEALRALGRHEQAAASFASAIALASGLAAAHNGLGACLHQLDRWDEALACYERSLALDPGFADAHANRGRLLAAMGRQEEALASLQAAIAHRGGDAQAHLDLGTVLLAMNRYGQALASLRKAAQLRMDLPCVAGQMLHAMMQVCDWDGFEAQCASVLRGIDTGTAVENPFTLLSIASTPAQQLRCARAYAERFHPAAASPAPERRRAGDSRIRLGYFSADFHDHATAHLISEVFERHDRKRFEVVAFSFGRPSRDSWRSRIEKGVDRFVDVAPLPAQRIAEAVREAGIDIAVDLKGYTQGSRTALFALRPAPLQVNYLGYPGTMGADYFDYLIADGQLIGPGEEAHYAEKVVLLPDSYQPNDSTKRIAASSLRRADLGLPETGFVFCCFNNFFKITPNLFAVWMRILSRVPGSVLWLLEKHRDGVNNLRRQAHAHGVEPDRLVFSPHLPLAEHLARHRAADLFLDTLHYNAHTTASDALWAGLPVLTCRGDTFAGRVGASLLMATGLPDLVTRSLPEFEQAAVALATNPAHLAAIRHGLEERRFSLPLFDSASYARHLEAAYGAMWDRRRQGLPPERIVVERQPSG